MIDIRGDFTFVLSPLRLISSPWICHQVPVGERLLSPSPWWRWSAPAANPIVSFRVSCGHLLCSFLFHLHLKVHIHWCFWFPCSGAFLIVMNDGIMRRLQDLPRLISVFVHAVIIRRYSFVSHFFKHCAIEVSVHSLFFSLHSMLCNCPAGSSSASWTLGCCWCCGQCDPRYCRSQGQGWGTTPTLPIDWQENGVPSRSEKGTPCHSLYCSWTASGAVRLRVWEIWRAQGSWLNICRHSPRSRAILHLVNLVFDPSEYLLFSKNYERVSLNSLITVWEFGRDN